MAKRTILHYILNKRLIERLTMIRKTSKQMTADQKIQSGAKPDRREALILAAFDIIAEKGFEGLRVRDVAARVGINGATLHHYFPTKEALIQAVVEYTTNRLRVTGSNLQGTPPEQLRMHLRNLYRMMQEEPALFVVLTEMSLRAQRDPVMSFLMQQRAYWQDQLIRILEAGIDQQMWPSDLDPVATSSAIITLVEGVSLWVKTPSSQSEQALRQLEKWLQID